MPVRIRDIERPHDLEVLEHGEDLVVYLEPFTRRLPSEIAAMGIEPPVSRAVPFPLVPRKRLIDLEQRLNRYLGGSLGPGHDRIGQFGRHLRGIAKRCDSVIVVTETGVAPKGLPEYMYQGIAAAWFTFDGEIDQRD